MTKTHYDTKFRSNLERDGHLSSINYRVSLAKQFGFVGRRMKIRPIDEEETY